MCLVTIPINQTFNQDGKDRAILKIKYYNPLTLIFQHLPMKEKVKIIEVNRMKNGYIIKMLTSVDVKKVIKRVERWFEITKGFFYRENFKISPFTKVIERVFALKKYI